MKEDGCRFLFNMSIEKMMTISKQSENFAMDLIRFNMKENDGRYSSSDTFYDTVLVVCGR
jgi:hypothetical protein